VEEFSSIYIFHLRGNQRTFGETSRREGGQTFGSGSRAPIAISILVKNPGAKQQGQIHFHDIGDYLTREDKLSKIKSFGSTAGVKKANEWKPIAPDAYGDWLKQRDAGFDKFMVVGDKKTDQTTIFENYSNGVKTQRDVWCFNASKDELNKNIRRTITFYNNELKRFNAAHPGADRKAREAKSESFPSADSQQISWTRALRGDLVKDRNIEFREDAPIKSLYRPFTKQWLYFDRRLNEIVGQMPRLFPTPELSNRAIMVKQRWGGEGHLALMIDHVVELQSDGGNQCFPLYLYEKATDDEDEGSLFAKTAAKDADSYTRRDGISDAGLAHFQAAYPTKGEGDTITKEDLFYYIYGLLHSPDYRSRYADNLGKELPRIPVVKRFADFMAFSKAGRDLAHWHLNYETVDCYKGVKLDEIENTSFDYHKNGAYRVEKMKFAKTRDPETNKSVNDKTTVIYNDYVTVRHIPLEAYEYVVNGKPALEWVMERQSVSKDKDSGITNDANLWATETMSNPKYPLELFLRVITVSLETMKIVNGLPKLDI
jgi:predicted helicase